MPRREGGAPGGEGGPAAPRLPPLRAAAAFLAALDAGGGANPEIPGPQHPPPNPNFPMVSAEGPEDLTGQPGAPAGGARGCSCGR